MGYAEQYGMLRGDIKNGWHHNTEPACKMTKEGAIEILKEAGLLNDPSYQYNSLRYIETLVTELLKQEGEIDG